MGWLARICARIPNNTRLFAAVGLPVPAVGLDPETGDYTRYTWARIGRIPYRDEIWKL